MTATAENRADMKYAYRQMDVLIDKLNDAICTWSDGATDVPRSVLETILTENVDAYNVLREPAADTMQRVAAAQQQQSERIHTLRRRYEAARTEGEK